MKGRGDLIGRAAGVGLVGLALLGCGVCELADSGSPIRTIEGPWTSRSHGLTLTVERIEVRSNDFRVHMTATNDTDDKLTLPLFGEFFIVDDRGHQYEAELFGSDWPGDVAPGATVSGYAEMTEPLDSGASSVRVTFTSVFGTFEIDSMTVADIPVE